MNAAQTSSTGWIPTVTDAEIREVERQIGVTFDEPRRSVLRSNETFDVQACPGSGKTTLLVAKLAILAGKWPHARRGMCVLSHTNVARQEIERTLAGTSAGQRLLSYPHFVGTIHGFVNEFLAMPLLRSEGHHVRLIDDAATGDYCRRLLHSVPAYSTARQYLEKKEQHSPDRTIRALRYEGVDLSLGYAGGQLPCGPKTNSYHNLAEIKKRASDNGLWRFDDMFAWAERLLAKCSAVTEFAGWRFPAVFMDEMQDTSQLQGSLLASVFPASACEVRQRFGDSNQAIYDSGEKGTTIEPFPSEGYRSLGSSQRFGSPIASKAEPLAPEPQQPSLVGEGPCGSRFPVPVDHAAMPHTIFLFDADSAERVLPAFGSLLLSAFPDCVLRSDAFLARAIGRIGKSDSPVDKSPRHLGDYWSGYEPRVAKLEPRPQTLADYFHLAQRHRTSAVDCAESVRTLLKGICELVEIVSPGLAPRGGHAARWLWESLRGDQESVSSIRCVVWKWCIESTPIVERSWTDKVAELRRALGPIIGTEWNPDADAFCQWSVEFAVQTTALGSEDCTTPNVYRFRQDGRVVNIDVGTIHSAKSQTHTATLVLESFFKKHEMEDLLPWICRDKRGAGPKERTERRERMRLIYTAMTRPSHLLCLAMRTAAMGQDETRAANQKRLEETGWAVRALDGSEGAT